jgi:NAD-dependent DNA ligase
MIVSINELSQEVRSKAEANSPWLEVDYLNEFLGFCGGVICDGLLLPKEAEAIHQRFLDQPALANAATLELLRNALAEALADNVLTENELRNVHSWLARLVGDGFSDTGLPNLGNVSNIASDASHNTPIEFAGRRFVLTGKMRIGERAEIANMIEAAGGTFDDRPTRKTDYVVVSTEASVLWRTTHFGTKLEKAKKLLDQGYPLRVVSETMLEAGLKRVLSAL